MSYPRAVRVFVVLATALLLQEGGAEAQRMYRQGSVQVTLWGDLKVKEQEGMKLPQAFVLLLKNVSGREIGRDTVAPNGRYRFQDVENGEYTLTVQAETHVVYREQFIIREPESTDLRKDIELEWKLTGGSEPSPEVLYARSPDRAELLQEARDAASAGDHGKATQLLEKLLKGDSNDFEAWTELGTARFQNQKFEDAAKAYSKALELRPEFLPALVNLGKLKLAQKEYQEAIDPLTKAVTLDPERAESQYLLGEAYLGIRKGSVAVGYLNEAIRLDPDGMADVHLRLARLYDMAGMKDRAAREYEAYLQKRPDSPQKKQLEQYIAKNKGS